MTIFAWMNLPDTNPIVTRSIAKKLLVVFFLSFAFNLVWENLHVHLYEHYQGGAITEWILLHASLADALMITIGAYFFMTAPFLRRNLWVSIVLGVLVAIGIETWALDTSRWAYNELMPVIPLINTGLTPTIQLGFLGYLALHIVGR